MKMTLHRALAELKLIDSKIEKQISNLQVVGLYQKGKKVGGVFDLEEFNNSAVSDYDSINSLIDRKDKIKSKIIFTNSTTNVTVGKQEMTIADAINKKASVKLRKALLERLIKYFNFSTGELNKANESINGALQEILKVTFGKENVKVSATDMENVSKPFLEQNEYLLADPVNISKKIESLRSEIEDFESEVDAALSEVNAVTFIDID